MWLWVLLALDIIVFFDQLYLWLYSERVSGMNVVLCGTQEPVGDIVLRSVYYLAWLSMAVILGVLNAVPTEFIAGGAVTEWVLLGIAIAELVFVFIGLISKRVSAVVRPSVYAPQSYLLEDGDDFEDTDEDE